MNKVIVGIGLPGSGKSTVLRPMASDIGAVYICPDDIRMEVTGDAADQSKNALVWKLAFERLGRALTDNGLAVFDATNANGVDRRKLVAFCRDRAETIEGIWFDTPLATSIERNRARSRVVPDEVIGRMYNQLKLDPPQREEGFDLLERRDTV
jgi:predicted kinase